MLICCVMFLFFFFKQKTAYEMRISDWSSDVCSSDLADQRRALDRGGHLAVLDQVGLRGREHELAAGDVDLAAAEIDGVEAALHRGDDLIRLAVAAQHVGVGHARQDRKSVVSGKSVYVRVDLGGRRFITKKKQNQLNTHIK